MSATDAFAGYREPPHNLEAEQGLLGALLVNNKALDGVIDIVDIDDFADPVHGDIYGAIRSLVGEGKLANPITLKRTLDTDPRVKEAGGAQYLVRLAASVVTVVNATDYARLIADCALRRRMIDCLADVVDRSYLQAMDVSGADLIDDALSGLDALATGGRQKEGAVPVGADVDGTLAHIEAAAKNGGRLLGMSTGLHALDAGTGGLLAPDLIVLAARPSMGKTSLARQIAYHVARVHGPVLFVSLEMSRRQQTLSLLAALSGLSVVDVLHGAVADGWPALNAAANALRMVPLHIDDRAALRVSQIRSSARRLKRKRGLSAVVVDYLQLMQPEGRAESQNVAVMQISGALKGLAKELEVPVLVLSQLNRGVEGRDDKRPALSDLRDSGAIEQDADQVWLLYREEYYTRRKEPAPTATADKIADWREQLEKVRGLAEVDVAKRRMGPVGRVELRFSGKTTSFGDPA